MSRRAAVLLFAVLALFARAAEAKLSGGLSTLGGDAGYKERRAELRFGFSPKIEWDDPDTPWPFNEFWLRARRTGYERDGADGASYRTEGTFGMRLFQRSGFEFTYAVTPELSEKPLSYRARAWHASATGGWRGLLPNIDPDAPSVGSAWAETRLTLSLGRTTHEEFVRIGTQPFAWNELKQQSAGVVLSETFVRALTLRVAGESQSYDRAPAELEAAGEFFRLGATNTAAPYETTTGFARRSWGAGVGQIFGEWAEANFDWRRSSYESGSVARADTLRGRLDVHLGIYFSLTGIYESFQPQGGTGSTFTGGGVGFRF